MFASGLELGDRILWVGRVLCSLPWSAHPVTGFYFSVGKRVGKGVRTLEMVQAQALASVTALQYQSAASTNEQSSKSDQPISASAATVNLRHVKQKEDC